MTSTNTLPLYVDLDGTLVMGDVSVEAAFSYLKKRPWALLHMLFWASQGRAFFKQKIAESVEVRPATLPYEERALSYLRAEAGKRTMILITASDERHAESIGKYLGIFSETIGSNGRMNLKGKVKLARIQEHAGGRSFSYIGNSHADLPIWRAAKEMIIVNASPSLLRRVRSIGNPVVIAMKKNIFTALVQEIRPHHWVKNALIFIPLLTAHALTDPRSLIAALVAAIAFSVVASSVYIANDLADIDADRLHVWKKYRPIARGTLSIPVALCTMVVLLGLGFGIASMLPLQFHYTLLEYIVIALLYTFSLKQKLIVDTVTLATLYTLRIIAGTAAAQVSYSSWLLAFSMFFFFSLALMKRFSELRGLKSGDHTPLHGRKYVAADQEIILPMGIASSYLAVLIFALYINSDQVRSLYLHPAYLWIVCPLLLTFVSRLWMIAFRNEMQRDPVAYVLTDITSLSLIALSIGVVFMAT